MINTPRTVVGIVLIACCLWFATGPASAHSAFESSDPADGAEFDGPIETVTLVFSGQAQPAGEGFVALDPSGTIREPDAVSSTDGMSWLLRFDPPLAGGTIGLRWTVQAPDAHPIDGGFSFTVNTVPAPETTTPPATRQATTAETIPTTQPSPVADSEAAAADGAEQIQSEAVAAGSEGNTDGDGLDLATFLHGEDTSARNANGIWTLGRALSLAGAVVGIGGLLFAALVLRGPEADIRAVLYWTRRAGLLLVIGATVELAAQLAVGSGGWDALRSTDAVIDLVGTPSGVALALRSIGGVALVTGARIDTHAASTTTDPIAGIRELAGVGAGPAPGRGGTLASPPDGSPIDGTRLAHPDDHAWQVGSGSTAFLGAVAVLAAFLFDGHTVTEGNRWLHAVVNVAHVSAAAVWAGGLLMLAFVLWRRHRRGEDARALQLAVRFSVVAAIALVAAGVAGTVLTIIVIDRLSDLWTTPWGRLLIAKVAFVAVAAASGAYNHRVLIPAMAAMPDNRRLDKRFREVVSIEALMLALVVSITAFLIGAAS